MKKAPQSGIIYVTEADYQRLSGLIEITRERNDVDREYLDMLEGELDRAEIVDPKRIARDVITMRSTVRLKDLVSGETRIYSLVFPGRPTLAKERSPYWRPLAQQSWDTSWATLLNGLYRQVYAGSELKKFFISQRLPVITGSK